MPVPLDVTGVPRGAVVHSGLCQPFGKNISYGPGRRPHSGSTTRPLPGELPRVDERLLFRHCDSGPTDTPTTTRGGYNPRTFSYSVYLFGSGEEIRRNNPPARCRFIHDRPQRTKKPARPKHHGSSHCTLVTDGRIQRTLIELCVSVHYIESFPL